MDFFLISKTFDFKIDLIKITSKKFDTLTRKSRAFSKLAQFEMSAVCKTPAAGLIVRNIHFIHIFIFVANDCEVFE